MEALAVAAPFLAMAGGATSVVGGLVEGDSAARAAKAQGAAERDAANYRSAQLFQQAGQERATAQRKAIEERRRSRLAQSRAVAIAAGSGGGATDPTVTHILGDLAGEGEYNALAQLYTGEESAIGLETQGRASKYEGKLAYKAGKSSAKAIRRASYVDAVGKVLTMGSNIGFASKYGANPNGGGVDPDPAAQMPAYYSFNREYNYDRQF